MTALSAGMTREQAAELLAAHNKDPFHIEHGETVEQTMRYFAREYDPENEEFWGIVGLLHDLDWEEHDDEPEMHTLYAAPLIEEAGGTPELIRAIQSHTSDFNTDLPKPELQMEKILFATEELTGLIGAAIIMRPSKSVMDFNVKSLKKKYKDKRFAAGVSREVIASGAEMLGWELDELFARTIEAMQSFAPDRDTFVGFRRTPSMVKNRRAAAATAGRLAMLSNNCVVGPLPLSDGGGFFYCNNFAKNRWRQAGRSTMTGGLYSAALAPGGGVGRIREQKGRPCGARRFS